MSQRQNRSRTAERRNAGAKGFRGPGVYGTTDLVPFARPGDYVELIPNGSVHQVESVVPVPTVMAFDADESNDITASSNSTTADQDATELEQSNRKLGQLRWLTPETDIPQGIDEVQLDLGGGQSPLWTTKNARGFVDRDTSGIVGYSPVTEIFVWEDTTPKFTFINNAGSNQTIQDLRFSGFSFELAPADAPGGAHVEPVPIESLRTNRG